MYLSSSSVTDRVLRLRLPNGALPCRGGLDARRLGTPGRTRGDLGGVPVAETRILELTNC